MTTLAQQPAFNQFLGAVDAAFRARLDPPALLDRVEDGARRLVSRDDWLPETAARPHPVHYRQYLLYCDPRERYSVVSFVWGIGQRTPIHDHMTWGVIAMLRGAERAERYERAAPMRLLGESVLLPGDVDRVSPRLGDIHRVSNACDDRVSISIHIYGGNIGRIPRHVYDVDTGARRAFVSGYANADAAAAGFARLD